MKKISFFLGILGPIVFVILSGLAVTLSGFSMSNPTSNVVNTPYGWLQNIAFITGGIGFMLLGYSMSLMQKKTMVAPYLVMFFGLVFVLEFFFPSDSSQNDPATMVHILLFAIGTVGMIVATGLFGSALSKVSNIISLYSFLTTLVSGIGFIGIFLTQGSVGLWQQVAIFPLLLWSEVLGIYTFTKSKQLL